MLFLHIFLVVAWMGSRRIFHVSGCDEHCAEKPVFTPSRLVVKYGDRTSATCVPCQGDCQGVGVEKSVGDVTENGTTLLWTVGKLTNWDPSPACYYNTDSGNQCCTFLPVVVYQPPEKVSISFLDHTGPMFEHSQYTLQCTVENVAPVDDLVVIFYRGQTELSQHALNNGENKPGTHTFATLVTASREDNGAQYWCEAELELGPEGPQPPPVVKSENITATVHWTELDPTRVQPAAATTPKTGSGPNSSATIITFHKFIMCVMFVVSTLV